MTVQKIKSGRIPGLDADNFVGDNGQLFFNEGVGDLRLGDGITPGGIPLAVGGGDGGNYILPTASTTVKGGVKVDNTTIAIANQVISVVNGVFTSGSYDNPTWINSLAYSKLTGAPTVPTNTNQLTNGSGYITSSALTGLATESFVTGRGYLSEVPEASANTNGGIKLGRGLTKNVDGTVDSFSGSYNDLTNKPNLFSGSYADLTNKPTIPTNTNQLTNGSGYITSSALTGLATETYVTTRGYLTAVSWNDVSGKPTFATVATSGSYADLTNKPTLFSGSYTDLTNKPTLVTSYTQLTDRPSLFSGSYTDLTNKPTIPTDINQLTDVSGLLGGGGEGGGTTYITNNVENPYAFNVAADDSTLREISNGETLRFAGATGISVSSDAEGKITITGPDLSSYATETYVTTQGYITSSALTGLATETYVTTRGYITSSSLTGLATETYVTTRGYLTSVSWNDINSKPTFATVATSGSYNDLADKPSIPSIGSITFTNTTIDTSDSSGILFGVSSTFNSDVTVENDLIVAGQLRNSSNQIYATQSFVEQAVTELIGAAPEALNTLQELAAALGNNENFATTILEALSAATNTVRYDTNTQNLTEQQKQNARTNIGAITELDIYATMLTLS